VAAGVRGPAQRFRALLASDTGLQGQAQLLAAAPGHDADRVIAKLRPGSLDCPACRPAAGSRTHLARRDDPYLLYLVVHRRWQRFGTGDHGRVRADQRGGAQVIQVLQGPFAQVVLAETALKHQHRTQTAGWAKRGVISSFGQGTEATCRRTLVSLTSVLPQGEDVTHWFR